MTKVFVFTQSAAGTTINAVESEELAKKLCIYAIGMGASFAFFSR